MSPTIVAIASDHAGFQLKQQLHDFVSQQGFEPLDLGAHSDDRVDYPAYGYAAAESIMHGKARFAIAICGSGIGISIAANRFPAVRAALCHDGLSAELARRHNDANILALGARLIGIDTAKECVIRFLNTGFEGGRHLARVDQLSHPNL